jgi:hypothetical protein
VHAIAVRSASALSHDEARVPYSDGVPAVEPGMVRRIDHWRMSDREEPRGLRSRLTGWRGELREVGLEGIVEGIDAVKIFTAVGGAFPHLLNAD